MTGVPNHGLCVACGAPHNQWPAIDEPDGELCDECYAAEAEDAWWDETLASHPDRDAG